jgi:hypothetical protein
MREIKFRACWQHDETGRYCFTYYSTGELIVPPTERYHLVKKDMQSTCLKDKNGKEIWEGDIVIFDNWKPKIVVYQDKSFAGFTLKDTLLFLTDYHAEEMQVIGNNHENPTLLLKTEETENHE